jgi:uncharacterized repeat protein (TIGR03806 family)
MSNRALASASWASFVVLFGVLHLLASCSGAWDGPDDQTADRLTSPDSDTTTGPAFVPPTDDPQLLSAWRQLETRQGRLELAEGVTPYTLNSPLFSDYAHKLRTVWMPEGAGGAVYDPDGPFDFPVGTVVTKTFYYPEPDDGMPDDGVPDDGMVVRSDLTSEVLGSLTLDDVRLVETRVLVRRDDGWHGLPYVWNAAETEATLQRTGAIVRLALVGDDAEVPFAYVVPDVNQCASCHATNHSTGAIETIGLQARHLNTEVDLGGGVVAQLDQWRRRGLLSGAPRAEEIPTAAVWSDDAASLEGRARAYLDINCAHCHNPVGAADASGLFLDQSTEIGPSFGVCKPPVAAGNGTGGRLVDIHPGKPDDSILVHRMETTDPAAMMPELGRSIAHVEGVDLIAQWIESLEGDC